MKGKGLLFGLNYSHISGAQLNGCINDVTKMSELLMQIFGNTFYLDIYTDDVNRKNTSYDGIIKGLYNLALDSYAQNLDFAWVHFSGHGTQYKDTSGDELDYMDEGICPSDFDTRGMISDDILNHVFSRFNPKTKVVFVSDCCHSGSILDLKYCWDLNTRQAKIDNKNCQIPANILLISGCMDEQTSADAFNLLNDKKHIGALTAAIIKTIEKEPDIMYNVFSVVSSVRRELRNGGFSQYPCLSSTYDILKDPSLIVSRQLPSPPKLHNKLTSSNSYYRPVPVNPVQRRPVPQYPQPNYYESQNTYAPPVQVVVVPILPLVQMYPMFL